MISTSTTRRTMRNCSILIAAILVWQAPASGQDSVTIHFENSCSASVQDEFDHAVTRLHSFEYPATTRLFWR